VRVRVRDTRGDQIVLEDAVDVAYHGGALTPTQDATAPRQNAARDGFQPEGRPAPPLEPAWTAAPGLAGFQDPLHAGGRVFTSALGMVRALDARDGRPLWARPIDGEGDLEVAYDDGRLFLQRDRLLLALDPATGAVLWRQRSAGSAHIVAAGGVVWAGSSYDQATGAPVIERGFYAPSVVVGDDADVFAEHEGCLLAYDRRTGDEQWRDCTRTGSYRSIAAVGAGVVLATDRDRPAGVHDSATGEVLRPFTLALPAVAGSTVFGLRDGRLIAEHARTGVVRWSFAPQPATRLSAPTVAGPYVYVAGEDRRLWALDRELGTVLWSGTTAGAWRTGPTVAHGLLLLQTTAGLEAFREAGAAAPDEPEVEPVALDQVALPPLSDAPNAAVSFRLDPTHARFAATKTPRPPLRKRWKIATRGGVRPVVADGRVFVAGSAGSDPSTVTAYDAATGAVLWRHVGDDHSGALAYDSGRLFAISWDDDVRLLEALDPATGAELWRRPLDAGFAIDAADGTVLVSNGSSVQGFRASDGTPQWAPIERPAMAQPAIVRGRGWLRGCGGWVSFGLADGAVDGACDTLDGGITLATDGGAFGAGEAPSAQITATPQAVAGNTAVWEDGGALTAIDTRTGLIRWRISVEGGIHTIPLIAGGTIYLVTHDKDPGGPDAAGYDLATGALVWEEDQIEEVSIDWDPTTELTVGGGLLLVPDWNGYLTAYESAAG